MIEAIALVIVFIISILQLVALMSLASSVINLVNVMKVTNTLIDKYVEAYTHFSEDWRQSWFEPDDNNQN